MSDTNNPTPDAGEPVVPPVNPADTGAVPPVPPAPPAAPAYTPPPAPSYQQPAPGGYQPPPTGGYQTPPPAPGYQQPPAYQAPPAGGYQTASPVAGYQQAPPPGYQPPAQQPYYGYQPPATPPMNTLAIVTIILAFVFSIAGIVTGHIALKQIDRTGESGRGLAKAGLIISYVFTGLFVLGIIAYFVIIALFLAAAGSGALYSNY